MATRRKHRRVRARGIGAQVLRGNELTLAPVDDLSVSGAFLRTAHHFDVGTLVDLSLTRPGHPVTLHIASRVANVRDIPGKPAGVGLQFIRLSPEQDQALRAILAELGVTEPDEGEAVEAALPAPAPPPPVPSSPRTQLFGTIDALESEIEEDVTPARASNAPTPVPSAPPVMASLEIQAPPGVPSSPTLTGEVNSRLISEVRTLLQDFDTPTVDEPPKEGFSAIADDAPLELHVDKSARHRRKHSRVRAQGVAAQVRSDEGVTTATVEDLSAGGAFLRTSQTYPIGATVNLTLVRPGMKRAINVNARVANVRSGRGKPAGIGVKFESIRAEAEERLKAILRDLGLVDPFQPDVPPPSEKLEEAKEWAPAPEPPPVDAGRTVAAPHRRGFNVLSVEQVDASVPSAGHYVDAKNEKRPGSLPPPISSPSLLPAEAAFQVPTPQPAPTAPPPRAAPSLVPPRVAPVGARPGVPYASAPPVATPPPPVVPQVASRARNTAAAFPGAPADPALVDAYAPTLTPRRAPLPVSSAPTPDLPPEVAPDMAQRMMLQIRGVLTELAEAQATVHDQQREIDSLKLEVERLRAELRIVRGK